jgi:predicted outer membrane repeat protein
VQCTALAHCTDGEECTDDYCTVANMCVNAPKADGEPCSQGACLGGVCGNVFPCTEQGIRDAIAAGGGPYTFACVGPTTVVTGSEIIIDNDVILDGEGELTVDGNDDHRVLSVEPGVAAELIAMTVTRGFVLVTVVPNPQGSNDYESQGGGILNGGTLTISDSVVEANKASGPGQGGGIYSHGTLTVVNSIIRGNTMPGGEGAGIYSDGSLVLIRSSVLDHGVYGGDAKYGCAVDSTVTLTLIDSEVSRCGSGEGATMEASGSLILINSTVGYGPYWGIYSHGTATVVNSTVIGSSDAAILHSDGNLVVVGSTLAAWSDYAVGVVASYEGMYLANTVIARLDSNPSETCNGNGIGQSTDIVSGGGNIESPTNDCNLTAPSDLVNVSAAELKLGTLQNNGGPTSTMALLPGSVAIDRVPEAMCVDAEGLPLTTDQRGKPRPETGGDSCDVGAFEVQP